MSLCRGVEGLAPEFSLPTCSSVFNIFHPVRMHHRIVTLCCTLRWVSFRVNPLPKIIFQFDPVAYRVEPLVVDGAPEKAVLMPHHKGRKRFHLGKLEVGWALI